MVGHAQRSGVQAGGVAQMGPLETMIKECVAPKIVMARLIWRDKWGSRAEARQQDKTEKQVTVGDKTLHKRVVSQTF